jgi:hypothetical protein
MCHRLNDKKAELAALAVDDKSTNETAKFHLDESLTYNDLVFILCDFCFRGSVGFLADQYCVKLFKRLKRLFLVKSCFKYIDQESP